MKTFNTKKIPNTLYWILAIIGAIAGAVLMFAFWGLEWYQENELEWEYGIFSIVFLIIHLIPFVISVLVGGGIGFFTGSFVAVAIDAIFSKACETQTDSTGKRILLTKPRKTLLVIALIIVAIPTIIFTVRGIEKQHIRNEITDYLSSEFGLKDVEVKFTSPYDDFYKYGVVIYSSNLDSLEYEKMTRIVYYFTSHTDVESRDVDIERFVCGNNNYRIFTTAVYMNGEKMYEYKRQPSSSITSADAPFVGMDTDFIGSTKLGSPDKTELCKDYKYLRPERQSITYKWYDSKGKLIFTAFTMNGKVVSVTDFRK